MLLGIACSFIYSAVRPWETPCTPGCFPKPALPAPSWSARQDAAMGAGCFDRSQPSPPLAPLLRFGGMLGTAVFAAVINGLRAIHRMWPAFGRAGVRVNGSSLTPSSSHQSLPARKGNDFSPALLLPRCMSPCTKPTTRVAAHSHRSQGTGRGVYRCFVVKEQGCCNHYVSIWMNQYISNKKKSYQ